MIETVAYKITRNNTQSLTLEKGLVKIDENEDTISKEDLENIVFFKCCEGDTMAIKQRLTVTYANIALEQLKKDGDSIIMIKDPEDEAPDEIAVYCMPAYDVKDDCYYLELPIGGIVKNFLLDFSVPICLSIYGIALMIKGMLV